MSTTPPAPIIRPGTMTGNTSATNVTRPTPRTGNSARDMSESEFAAALAKYNIRM